MAQKVSRRRSGSEEFCLPGSCFYFRSVLEGHSDVVLVVDRQYTHHMAQWKTQGDEGPKMLILVSLSKAKHGP